MLRLSQCWKQLLSKACAEKQHVQSFWRAGHMANHFGWPPDLAGRPNPKIVSYRFRRNGSSVFLVLGRFNVTVYFTTLTQNKTRSRNSCTKFNHAWVTFCKSTVNCFGFAQTANHFEKCCNLMACQQLSYMMLIRQGVWHCCRLHTYI